jgi:hypothetical protein
VGSRLSAMQSQVVDAPRIDIYVNNQRRE